MNDPPFHVIERSGWSYVVDADGCEFGYSGPWRYRWEAQEYADELNGKPKPGDDLSYYLGPDAKHATQEQCDELERNVKEAQLRE